MGSSADAPARPQRTPGAPFVLAVASGKGGTGKTLVATNLAVRAADAGRDVVLVDCDADAPNDHLFLPRAHECVEPVQAQVAEVDRITCTACGACRDACAYGAVRVLGRAALVFEELCHGCELCVRVCPSGAVTMVGRRVGTVASGEAANGVHVVSGVLDIGQVKAPEVIRRAVQVGLGYGPELAILDAPPGVACPVVAALHDADALLLVTEPTPFGVHDLELALQLGSELGIPAAIVVNKAGPDVSVVEDLARAHGVPVLAVIPFDRRMAEVYADGRLTVREIAGSAVWLDAVLEWAGQVAADRVRAGEAPA